MDAVASQCVLDNQLNEVKAYKQRRETLRENIIAVKLNMLRNQLKLRQLVRENEELWQSMRSTRQRVFRHFSTLSFNSDELLMKDLLEYYCLKKGNDVVFFEP